MANYGQVEGQQVTGLPVADLRHGDGRSHGVSDHCGAMANDSGGVREHTQQSHNADQSPEMHIALGH